MHIKDLAQRAGVTVRAVRYYESRGLITPRREANGYRAYDDADVHVVREVRALLSLGMTAEETHPFVECLRAGHERADPERHGGSAVDEGEGEGEAEVERGRQLEHAVRAAGHLGRRPARVRLE